MPNVSTTVLVTYYLAGWMALACLYFFRDEILGDFCLFLGFIVLMPVFVAVLIYFLFFSFVTSVKVVSNKRLRWAIAGPLVMLALLSLLPRLGITPIWLRFQCSRFYFAQKIADMKRSAGEPLLVSFDWGGSGIAGMEWSDYLVYDKTDQIQIPMAKR